MSWSAPMTAVAGSVFTANQYNTYIRDNLLETGVAKVTEAGQYLVTEGVNSVGARTLQTDGVFGAAESTTSTSYTDLTTAGPSVTVDTGAKAIVVFSSNLRNNTAGAGAWYSYGVSGATSSPASDSRGMFIDGVSASNACRWGGFHIWTTLTPGTNTFTMKYRASTNTALFNDRQITVLPF